MVQQSYPNSHLWGSRQNANEGQDAVVSLEQDKDQGGGMGLVLANNDTGVLGISGQAAARIDLNGAESLTLNHCGLASGYAVGLKTVSWGNRAANGSSGIKLLDADTAYDFLVPNTATFGSTNLGGAGFIVATGEGLSFTTKDNSAITGTAGAGPPASRTPAYRPVTIEEHVASSLIYETGNRGA